MSRTPKNGQVVRVLVVTDVRASREALVAALTQREHILAIGNDLGSASSRDGLNPFDLILVDVSAPAGMNAIGHFCRRFPAVPVIAFGVASASADIMACAEAGAAGYALSDASIAELVDSMFAVASGELVCSPKMAYDLFRLAGSARPARAAESIGEFTPREQQVFMLLSEGLSNKEIASTLGIAVSTVKIHVHHVLEKCDAPSRKHAARKSHFMLAEAAERANSNDLVRFALPM
jgi:two-component system, NarL family, nitrate/nitrite response regulator NarL